ncbi:hypothetical protein [Streptomyces sp. NBC_00009]|uniref:hypothetical protein n=1 Tax=Streptomyces sp. NBC_00009 TaxID=2975620 RepID=UPI00324D9BE3
MPEVEFYVDATLRKRILDVPLSASPKAWEDSLGEDFLDDVQKSRMRRDYGLVEISFVRRNERWESTTVSLQIHRLARGIEGLVPLPLRQAYGEFSESLKFEAFRIELERRGGALEDITDVPRGDFIHYRESNTTSSVYVAKKSPLGDAKNDALWSIVLTRD